LMAGGGVADVRRLAVNEELMKVVATNGYKKATKRQAKKTPRTSRGVFRGCGLCSVQLSEHLPDAMQQG
jgi:hypothetical protein